MWFNMTKISTQKNHDYKHHALTWLQKMLNEKEIKHPTDLRKKKNETHTRTEWWRVERITTNTREDRRGEVPTCPVARAL